MAKRLTALGADIFAGLFTVGIKRAGYKVLGHLEHGAYGAQTMALNHPDVPVRIGAQRWQPEDFQGKVDFMFTNPPCAAWSNAGRGSNGSGTSKPWQEHTERLNYVRDLVDAGTVIQPRAWCWESVPGAWTMGQEFVLEQARVWNQHGYHATVLLQNNMYLGGKQDRKRIFLLAHRHPLVWQGFTRPPTVAQVLAQVKRDVRQLKLKPRPHLKPYDPGQLIGELWRRSATTGGYLRRPFQLMEEQDLKRFPGRKPMALTRRMLPNQPAPVMIDGVHRYHPDEPRCLNEFEYLALCDLPYDWQTGATSYGPFTHELARAVMPAVGEWLGRSVAAGLSKKALPTDVVTISVADLRQPFKEGFDLREATTVLESHRTGPQIQVPRTFEPKAPLPDKAVRMAREPRLVSADRPHVPRGLGIGRRIREYLVQGLGTQEILTKIHQEFPSSKATASDIGWNRGKLKKEQQRAA